MTGTLDPGVDVTPIVGSFTSAGATARAVVGASYRLHLEHMLLGAIMAGAADLDAIQRVVSFDDFTEPLHARIYAALTAAHHAGIEADDDLLRRMLGDIIDVEIDAGTTVADYLGILRTTTFLPADPVACARQIRASAGARA
jgi:replicative DNA helicase